MPSFICGRMKDPISIQSKQIEILMTHALSLPVVIVTANFQKHYAFTDVALQLCFDLM